MPGPRLRTDLVEVFVFRRQGGRTAGTTFLQLRRAATAVMPGSWQPVIGHVEGDERAVTTALRELEEETGLRHAGLRGLWQLEEPNIYFLHAAESIVLAPCFAAEAPPEWEPVLNEEHDAHRWIRLDHADNAFLWPGQRKAIEQISRDVLAEGAAVADVLRVDLRSGG